MPQAGEPSGDWLAEGWLPAGPPVKVVPPGDRPLAGSRQLMAPAEAPRPAGRRPRLDTGRPNTALVTGTRTGSRPPTQWPASPATPTPCGSSSDHRRLFDLLRAVLHRAVAGRPASMRIVAGAVQKGVDQCGALQVCLAQVGISQVGAIQPGLFQAGPAQISFVHICMTQVSASQVGLA